MIDPIDPTGKGGALAGIALLGFIVLRWVGLRLSKDAVTLKADAADRDSFKRLQARVELLDRRLGEVEHARNHLFGFITKCMAYISRCECDGQDPPTREELQADYTSLIRGLADNFHKE